MKRNGISRRALIGNFAMLGVAAGPGRALAQAHTLGEKHTKTPIFRDFSDPYLELIRLLKEAAEIEHDLMVEYLYCAFSVKPAYAELVGAPVPGSSSLMGVIVEEMQHLGAVNRLIVELNAAPVLARQDFPYESDLYPFAFELAPLGRTNLARYTYCEAAPDDLPKVVSTGNASAKLLDQLRTTLGGEVAPNHVGHLYDAVIDTLGEVKKAGAARLDFDAWDESLVKIKSQGEVGHFKFFQSLYEGTHPLFKEVPGVWDLPASDPRHPCYQVPVNPTAYAGHANSIADADLRAVAWLGNLNYWLMLSLLDASYRRKSPLEVALAQAVMMGPLMSLSRYLPTKGAAIPFDPLSMGFEPGLNPDAEKQFTRRMLDETRNFARSIKHLLPADFRVEIYDQLAATV